MTCDEKRFLGDVAQHEMTIIRDDGLYRHIRFKRPGSSAYWFDILTWPSRLCISGDMGDYVFSRLPDMFEFFRREPNEKGAIPINPDYWGEKLVAISGRGRLPASIFRWDHKQFKKCVSSDVESYIEHRLTDPDSPYADLLKAAKRDLWEAVRDEVLGCDEDEFSAMTAIRDFSFDYECGGTHWCDTRERMVPDMEHFCFQDFYEHNCKQYDFSFLWILHAVVWGIQQYDARKARPWYRLAADQLRTRSPIWKRREILKTRTA